ncbi:phage portal protein [Acetobacterium wieringae]|uniref:Phage portal protein n=1 Tax=Acetobacterium wieringae TaxID=52694 RepID=A0ABY6HBF5_9FIRM|nr:phage portal protein [Acetobacterium wieringae]UYO61821.1 phage portal protein [Acetobacterium wieringae]
MNIIQKWATKAFALTNNPVFTKILMMNGGIQKHTEVNYNNMCKEGYQNFVVYACLDKIVKAATAINWEVATYSKDGALKKIPNHPMKLLIENPNPMQGQSKFLERAIKFFFIGGETFIHKIDIGKTARELYCYRPDRCIVEFGKDAGQPIESFKYQAGSTITIDPSNILHWKSFNPMDEYDGLGRGLSLLAPAARVIDQNNAIKQWNYSLMKNGAKKDGAFVIKEMLSDDAYDRAKEALKADYNGDNPGGYMLLEGGADFRDFGNNPKDTDWLEGSKQTIVEICASLGVDPILIGFNEFSSYNNKSEAKKSLYTETVIPLLRELADELGQFLGLADSEFFYFDLSDIAEMQENIKEKFDMVSGVTFMTENDKREYVGLDAKDGLNVYRIPMSYIDIPEGQPIQPPQPTGDDGNDDVNFKALSGGGEQKSIKQTKALQVFNAAIEAGIKKQQPIIGKYFIDQAKRIKKGFKRADPIEIKADDQQELTEDQLKTLLDSLLDWDAENELFASTIVQLYLESMGVGYSIADEIFALNLKETGIEPIMNEDLLKWARESAAQQVTYVNQTTKDQIKRIISDGMEKGLSNAEIAQNIFDQSQINSIGRAKRIASTEVHNSIIKGNHQAMVDAGVKKKKWVTAKDKAVRGNDPKDKANHVVLNGQIRDINKPFSNGLMHPGDPDGPAKEITECRCIEVPADFE